MLKMDSYKHGCWHPVSRDSGRAYCGLAVGRNFVETIAYVDASVFILYFLAACILWSYFEYLNMSCGGVC